MKDLAEIAKEIARIFPKIHKDYMIPNSRWAIDPKKGEITIKEQSSSTRDCRELKVRISVEHNSYLVIMLPDDNNKDFYNAFANVCSKLHPREKGSKCEGVIITKDEGGKIIIHLIEMKDTFYKYRLEHLLRLRNKIWQTLMFVATILGIFGVNIAGDDCDVRFIIAFGKIREDPTDLDPYIQKISADREKAEIVNTLLAENKFVIPWLFNNSLSVRVMEYNCEEPILIK